MGNYCLSYMPTALISREIVQDDCDSKPSLSLGFFLSFLKCSLPPLLPSSLPPSLSIYLPIQVR